MRHKFQHFFIDNLLSAIKSLFFQKRVLLCAAIKIMLHIISYHSPFRLPNSHNHSSYHIATPLKYTFWNVSTETHVHHKTTGQHL